MEDKDGEGIVLGIDIGGTKICLALVTGEGSILHSVSYPADNRNLESFIGELYQQIDNLLQDYCVKQWPKGIGIGIKGFVDVVRQRLDRSSMFQILVPYDLCSELQKRYKIKAVIDNDVHAATLAEARFGAWQDEKDFAYINIGTGIAAGVIADGKLLRGKYNYGGELGFVIFERDDDSAPIYTLESVSSGKGMEDEARRLESRYPPSILEKYIKEKRGGFAYKIFEAYKEGDELAQAVVKNALRDMALSVYNLEMLYNSCLYVFGGGVVSDGWFLQLMREEIENLCLKMGKEWSAELKLSTLGADNVGVLGAACILMESINM